MNIVDILATTFLTTIAGATVAFVSIHLKERIDKRKLFKALYIEIKLNHKLAENHAEQRDFGISFNFKELAFQRIMISGELYDLPSDIISNLDNAYSSIHRFNNKELLASSIDECKDIEKRLSHLIEELPKNLKFLHKENNTNYLPFLHT